MVRPRRNVSTSTTSSPGATWAAKATATERRRWSGRASSAAMARSPMAVTTPPCGRIGALHSVETVDR